VSRILFAWELGGGFGHLGPFRPIAEALLARGHELTLVVRDVERAHAVFGSLAVTVVQAPLCTKTYNGLAEPPLNYAEILMRYGYLDPPLLSGLLRSWRGLLDMTQADLLIADHAPTALLAARGRKLALAVTGGAFCVPPPVNPTPNMRHWVNVPAQRLASSDESVLRVINSVLSSATPRLNALNEIFDGAHCFFNGVSELDPFGPRDPSGFLGLYSGVIGSAMPRWPEGRGPQVFAYLNGDYRHLDTALAALAASGARCLVYLLGGTPAIRHKYEGPNLVFSAELLDTDQAVQAADLCVCHANFGTVLAVLRGGKPLLLLPFDLEKFLTSASLEKLGVGRMVHPEAQPVDISGALAQMFGSAAYSDAAKAFARRHREPPIDTIISSAARRIEALALGQTE
jgi:hypothetical protein